MRSLWIWAMGTILTMGQLAAAHEGYPEDHPSNELDVLDPPRPSYPYLAAVFGLEGSCEVVFSVENYGHVVRVDAARCTNLVFCDEATNAIRATRFRVRDVEGAPSPGTVTNVVYPFEFSLQDDMPEPVRETWTMKDCPLGTGLVS